MELTKGRSRGFGLLPRLTVALAVVGLVPLSLLAFGLFDANREAMREQVKRTHIVAARSTARQIDAHVGNRRDLATALAENEVLTTDPRSRAGQQVLAATLEASPWAAAVILRDANGAEVIRAQWPEVGPAVGEMTAQPADSPVVLTTLGEGTWLRYTVWMQDGRGTVELVEEGDALDDLMAVDELGRQADLAVVDGEGAVLAGSRPDLVIPPELRETVTARRLSGAHVVAVDGRDVIVAVAPLPVTGWTAVSLQPTTVAEAFVDQLRVRSSLAVGVSLVLVIFIAWLGYLSVVRPLREIADEQELLTGVAASTGGDELGRLRESLDVLRARVRGRQALEDVFLGRYQVIEVLGEGGMGTVFRAWDPKLKRTVALKTIQMAEDGASGTTERLLDEAVAAASFNHNNVVGVYDVADSGDAAYVAMEYVNGVSLAVLLWERERLEPELAVPLTAAIAHALDAAHRSGLVHRDIKPGNILLGRGGEIKVSDFGIATFVSGLRPSGRMIFGTPGYIAPEVARGEGWVPASDCFALGVVLYEVLIRTIVRYPPPLSEVAPSVSAELSDLCEELMSKAPDRRPTAEEAARRLDEMARAEGWSWHFPTVAEGESLEAPRSKAPTRWLPTIDVATDVTRETTLFEAESPARRADAVD